MRKERHLKLGLPIAGALMAVAITGCAAFDRQVENPTISPTPIIEPVERYPEIELYYPSLSAFAVRESGEIDTERSSTEWFNLSSSKFDPKLAGKAIGYFEQLAINKNYIEYYVSGRSIPLFLDLKPRTDRVIFLTPPQAPIPDWDQDISYSAATTGVFKDGPYVTFVRVSNEQEGIPPSKVFITTDRSANKALAVEICQSTIQIRSSTTEMANLGQEIFCNSWGAAFTLKQYGLTYNQYAQWAKTTSIRANSQSPSYSLYVLTESDYQQILKVGPIINN